jgi:hypothetical protein
LASAETARTVTPGQHAKGWQSPGWWHQKHIWDERAMNMDKSNPHDEPADGIQALVNPTARFVGEWMNEHVVEKPIEVPSCADQVMESAKQCVADARAGGIEPEEIEAEVGDIKEYIAEILIEEHPALSLELPRIEKPLSGDRTFAARKRGIA